MTHPTAPPLIARQRGGATVEMAVLMVVFVPLVLYAMFLSDAMFHQLEVQETVVGTLWDLSTRGFGRGKKPLTNNAYDLGTADVHDEGQRHLDQVGGYNRIQFADHTSAFTNEGALVNGPAFGSAAHMKHHHQPYAHVCWCNDAGCTTGNATAYDEVDTSTQVYCKFHRGTSAESYSLDLTQGAARYRDNASEGGVVECWAKGWLYNYVISENFLSGMSNFGKAGPLFNRKRRTASSIHANQNDPSADFLLRDRAGLLVDSWALTDPADDGSGNIERGGTGPNASFYNRARMMFTNPWWYGAMAAAVENYAAQALGKKLALVIAIPGVGVMSPSQYNLGLIPNILGLWTVVKHPNWSESALFPYSAYQQDDYYTTPLYDDDEGAFDARGKYYLAATSAELR